MPAHEPRDPHQRRNPAARGVISGGAKAVPVSGDFRSTHEALTRQLQHLVNSWGYGRGLAAAARPFNAERLNNLDHMYARQYQELSRALRGRLDAGEIGIRLERAYERGRMAPLIKRVRQIGKRVGELQRRGADDRGVARLKSETLMGVRAVEKLLRENGITTPALLQFFRENFMLSMEQGIAKRARAEESAIALHGLLMGGICPALRLPCGFHLPGYDFKVYQKVAQLHPSERRLLAESFEDRYGLNLGEALAGRVSGRWGERACALLRGDLAGAVSIGIQQALSRRHFWRPHGRCVDEIAAAVAPLRFLPHRQRSEVCVRVSQRIAERSGRAAQKVMESRFGAELKGDPLTRCAYALLRGDFASADALRLTDLLDRLAKDPKRAQAQSEEIARFLRGRSWDSIKAIAGCFSKMNGHPKLIDAMNSHLCPGAAKDLVLALLSNRQDDIFAARLRCGFKRVPGFWLGNEFLGKEAALRRRKMHAYLCRYEPERLPPGSGSGRLSEAFTECVRARFKPQEAEILKDLCRGAHVPIAKLFYFCVRGFGCDIEGLRSLLSSASQPRLREAFAEYPKVWKELAPVWERAFPFLFGNLSRRILWEVRGDNWFDLNQLLNRGSAAAGANGTAPRQSPGDFGDTKEMLTSRYAHETSGSLLKWMSNEVEFSVLRRDMQELQRFYEGKLKHGAAAETRLEDMIRLRFLSQAVQSSAGALRNRKYYLGRLAGQIAASAASLPAWYAAYHHPHLPTVMMLTFGLCLSTRVLMKKLIRGQGYHALSLEGLSDCGAAAVDGVNPALLLTFNFFLFRKFSSLAGSMGLDRGIQALTRLVQDKGLEDLGVPTAALGGATYEQVRENLIKKLQLHGAASRAGGEGGRCKSIFDLQYLIWKDQMDVMVGAKHPQNLRDQWPA